MPPLESDIEHDKGVALWLFTLTVGILITILGAAWFSINSQLGEKFSQIKEDIQRMETDRKEGFQRIENDIDKKASKDDLNQKMFELIQKFPPCSSAQEPLERRKK